MLGHEYSRFIWYCLKTPLLWSTKERKFEIAHWDIDFSSKKEAKRNSVIYFKQLKTKTL